MGPVGFVPTQLRTMGLRQELTPASLPQDVSASRGEHDSALLVEHVPVSLGEHASVLLSRVEAQRGEPLPTQHNELPHDEHPHPSPHHHTSTTSTSTSQRIGSGRTFYLRCLGGILLGAVQGGMSLELVCRRLRLFLGLENLTRFWFCHGYGFLRECVEPPADCRRSI